MTCQDRSPITYLERDLEERLEIYNPPADLDQRRIHLVETARHKIDELEARLAERAAEPGWAPQ